MRSAVVFLALAGCGLHLLPGDPIPPYEHPRPAQEQACPGGLVVATSPGTQSPTATDRVTALRTARWTIQTDADTGGELVLSSTDAHGRTRREVLATLEQCPEDPASQAEGTAIAIDLLGDALAIAWGNCGYFVYGRYDLLAEQWIVDPVPLRHGGAALHVKAGETFDVVSVGQVTVNHAGTRGTYVVFNAIDRAGKDSMAYVGAAPGAYYATWSEAEGQLAGQFRSPKGPLRFALTCRSDATP